MKFSKSPITNIDYEIPKFDSDQQKIDMYLDSNHLPVVVVQGLGFVGSAMALVVANSLKYKVIGIDLNSEYHYWKIASLNDGMPPLQSSDKKIAEYLDNARVNKTLYATFDPYAYSKADVIIVDINLDVEKKSNPFSYQIESYNVQIEKFEKAIRAIGRNCRNDCLVLVETTVPPGTCDKIVLPILKEEIRKRNLDFKIKVGHSYERVMPGEHYLDSIENFYRVYSGVNIESADRVEIFLKNIIKTDSYPLTRLKSTRASEMAKVLENSYRAVNIALIEEWNTFAQKSEVDLNEVIAAIKLRPTHSNLMRPGLGVGGYCLTKDPLLASWALERFFDGPKMELAVRSVEINDCMPITSLHFIQDNFGNLANKKVLLLGVSYLGNVGDTRFTPVELLYDKLIEQKAEIKTHDYYLTRWEEKKTSIDFCDLESIPFKQFDIVVLCTNHSAYKHNQYLLDQLVENHLTVFDLNYCLSEKDVLFLKNKVATYSFGNFKKD